MKRLLFGLAFIALFTAIRRGRSRKAPPPRASSADSQGPTYDEIALRAYFIGLDHDANGHQHDPLRDWAEAERELLV